MKVLIKRFLEEPAVALGVLAALSLVLGEAFLGDGLQASDLPAIGAPIVASGLTRQLVKPK